MNQFLYLQKQAWVNLRKKQGFVAIVVSTMGTTLGALLCILTLAYVLIVNPLPYPEQEHLYQLEHNFVDSEGSVAASDFNYGSAIQLYQDRNIFSESALSYYSDKKLSDHPLQPMLHTTNVTPEWFTLLDTRMVLGRKFEHSEARETHNPVAILSYDSWQTHFSGDPDILNKKIDFWGVTYRIVGVTAQSFIEPALREIGRKTDVYMPWDFNPLSQDDRQGFSGHDGILFFGKISSTMTVPQIEQTLSASVNETWREQVVGIEFLNDYHVEIKVNTLKSAILRGASQTVYLLLAGVIGLVLIALANIANQFISRTAEKQHELSIHAALGATKRHLFKVLLAESGILMFLSMVLALVIANVGFFVLQSYLAQKLPRVDELALNSFTLVTAVVITVFIALFFARLSNNMINYRALRSSLQSSGKGTGIQVSKKVRKLLIVSQVTIVTMLIFVNISIFKESYKVIDQPIGFETHNVSTLYLGQWSDSAASIVSTVTEIGSKLEQLPEIKAVSHAFSPFDLFDTPAHIIVARNENLVIKSLSVDEKYFTLIGQTFLEGDDFNASDIKDVNKVVIINEVYAKHLTPSASALGRLIQINGETPSKVIGIVKGIKIPGETKIPMRAYFPWPVDKYRLKLLLKLEKNQIMPIKKIIKIANDIGAPGRVNYSTIDTWEDHVTKLLFTQYTTATTSAILTLISLFLAAIGLYGILNYSTQLRRFELGTRMAIGANRKDIIGLIVKDSAVPVIIGGIASMVILLVLYIGFSTQLANFVNAQSLLIFCLTSLLVSSIALFACYWP